MGQLTSKHGRQSPAIKTDGNLQIIAKYLFSRLDRLRSIMPADCNLTPEELITFALRAIAENSALLLCSPESIWIALHDAARLGLEVGGPLAEFYIVPYKGKAQGQPGYRGLLKLVRESNPGIRILVEKVYEGDTFERKLGLDADYVHTASSDPERETRPITHVYSAWEFANGKRQFFVMLREQLDDHAEKFSRSLHGNNPDESPWKKSWEAMAFKTVLRLPIMRGWIPVVIKRHGREIDVRQQVSRGADIAGVIFQSEEPPPQLEQTKPAPKSKKAEKSPALNLEELEMELALVKTAEELQQVEASFVDGLGGPEAATVKSMCDEKRKQLTKAMKDRLFETAPNAAED